jgi:negative regulator of sigma E activity
MLMIPTSVSISVIFSLSSRRFSLILLPTFLRWISSSAWNPPPQAVVTLEVTIIVSTEAREVTKVETGLRKEARGMTVVAVAAWVIAVAVVGMNSLVAETEVVEEEEAVTTTTTEVVEEDETTTGVVDETTTGVVIEEDAGTTVVTVAEECMFLQAHTKHLRSLAMLGEAVSQLMSLMLQ